MSSVERLRESERPAWRDDAVSRIYVHFLDFYTYARSRQDGVSQSAILTESRRALRLSVLFAEQLLVPASSYFESRVARRLIREHAALADLGVIHLAAAEESLTAHRGAKLAQYDSTSPAEIRNGYRSARLSGAPPYLRRDGSSVAAIRADWIGLLERDELAAALDPTGALGVTPELERHWARVPTELGGRAFVTAHVSRLLGEYLRTVPETRVASVIETSYIRSYARGLEARLVTGFSRLRSRTALPYIVEAFSFQQVQRNLVALRLDGALDILPVDSLLVLRALPEWNLLKPWLDTPHARITKDVARYAEAVEHLLGTTLAHERGTTIDLHAGRSRRLLTEEPTIAIVTALPEEQVAAQLILASSRRRTVPGDSAVYLIGEIPSRHAQGRSHQVVLTQLDRMGTNSAASSTTALVRSFPSVTDVIMVGIACAIPNVHDVATHVRLGDIVVSDRRGVIQFDYVTVTADGALAPPCRAGSAGCGGCVAGLRRRPAGIVPRRRRHHRLGQIVARLHGRGARAPEAACPAVPRREGEDTQHRRVRGCTTGRRRRSFGVPGPGGDRRVPAARRPRPLLHRDQ